MAEANGHDDGTRETDALSGVRARGADDALQPGARVGRYRILRALGSGGMGEVYLAHDDALDRQVALKRMTRCGPVARARFAREARAIGALRDPRVATIFDAGEIDGVPYLSMEFIEGRELRALVGDVSIALAARLRILEDLAEGLRAAHAQGVVHRDVKPENVVVRPLGEAVLIDFGIARREDVGTGREEGSITEPGGVIGTPRYMSPEQIRGEPLDPRTDQFSWGVLAYELLSGSHPFASSEKPPIVAILEDAPARLDLRVPEAPRRVLEAITRALEKDRSRRFASMGALLDHLCARAPTSARFHRSSIATIGALGALIGSFVVLGGFGADEGTAERVTREEVTTSVASPPGGTVTIAALPLRSATSDAAAKAYRAALQSFEDNDWDAARQQLDRASDLDPELAEAYVQRLVAQCDADTRNVEVLHSLFQNGWRRRAQLSPRDLALLEAHEPIAAREPQDLPAYRARIAAAAQRFPGDVQLALLAAMEIGDSAEAIAAFERILELDPDCANAGQLKARHELMLGRTADAERTLDACVERAPASQCLEQRVVHWAEEGACDRMERDARTWVARSAGSPRAYWLLANALARETTDEGVLEALRQRAAQLSGEERTVAEAIEPARLDVLRGRFDLAEQRARALIAKIEPSPNSRAHAAAEGLLVELLRETGRLDEAARIGEAFLRRRRAWNNDGAPDDGVPAMLGALRAGGLLDEDAAKRDAAAWVQDKRLSGYVLMLPYLGVLAYGGMLDARDDAEAALSLVDVPLPRAQAYAPVIPARALHGRARSLTRHRDAVDELRRATRSCAALEDPFVHVRASLWLGEALEHEGDVEGACAAYEVLASRWGTTEPQAVSLARAIGRRRALRCQNAR